MQLGHKIPIGKSKYKCKYCKFKWGINLKCNTHMRGRFKITHLDGLDTFKWSPNPKCNTHMQGHFEITCRWFGYPLSENLTLYVILVIKVDLK